MGLKQWRRLFNFVEQKLTDVEKIEFEEDQTTEEVKQTVMKSFKSPRDDEIINEFCQIY